MLDKKKIVLVLLFYVSALSSEPITLGVWVVSKVVMALMSPIAATVGYASANITTVRQRSVNAVHERLLDEIDERARNGALNERVAL